MEAFLTGISEKWLNLLDIEKFKAIISSLGDLSQITPPPHLVLDAFRYCEPDEIIAVIISQDPYPGKDEAQGICFSVRTEKLPKSLANIIACLKRAGLCDGCSGDLRPWAAQGVLMLNVFLTTRVGKRRAHALEWQGFIYSFMKKLCLIKKGLHLFLWGNDAKIFANLPDQHPHVWTHPSPLINAKLRPELQFEQCNHFELIKDKIIWDNFAPIRAFTDGACKANGKNNARASFAVIITGGHLSKTRISGEIAGKEYKLVDDKLIITDVDIIPTNNRGELLAIAYCLLSLLLGCAIADIEIFSDSEISIKTITEWYPNRLSLGTEHELKNLDLIKISYALYTRLQQECASVKFIHVKCSHGQKKPNDDAPIREKFLYEGNKQVDTLAKKAIKQGNSDYAVSISSLIPRIKSLGK